MKKILAFLLAATLLCAMFVLPSVAADDVNYAADCNFTNKAPVMDGKVTSGEYGSALPFHTYSKSKSQFNTDHDEYGNWDFDFHMTWDKDNLYMAWVVKSDIGASFPEQDFDNNGSFGESDYGHMWEYSCVQFILVPGTPDASQKVYQLADYSGNYMEVGLTLTTEGNPCRVAWSKPVGAEALTPNDWDALIVRDDSAKTTTYEVRIPWNKSGLKTVGDGAQFGLTYAVAAQEQYTSVKKGMIEWQDAVLGGKNADAAAVITLKGGNVQQTEISYESVEVTPELPEGTVPAEAEGKVQLPFDAVDTGITAEAAVFYTSPAKMANTRWAHCLLLKPVDGGYEVVESKTGDGTTDNVVFASAIEDGMVVAAFHSDGTEGAKGAERRAAAAALVAGDKLAVFGIENGEMKYSNAMLYVTTGTEGGDVSGDTSDVESSAAVESSEEPSEAESKVESKVESSVAASSSSDPAEEDEGSLLWLWIVIGVVVVAGAAVAVIVLKKKKA